VTGFSVRRVRKAGYRGILFLVALVASIFLNYSYQPVSTVQAQPAVITNQASASFADAAGNVQTVQSNETTVQLGPVPPEEDEPAQLEIIKTADRGAGEPGDVVIYRLLVTNRSTRVANPVTVVDQLPRGLLYVEDSVRTAPLQPTSVTSQGSQLRLEFPALGPDESISIVYGVLLTPGSVRGDGRNVAQASAPGFTPSSSAFQIAIRPGILADCGTIIGRVFEDFNFDGEQQPGEPGVPNAVIFLDDGNRILTDPEGLFSVINVLSGNRVGTLDLYSMPGYALAPNRYRLENNSLSRLVRLAPGSMARMNFAVTSVDEAGAD
jgi:uncharacterized repeat protein (TIGR01451 family)